MISNTFVSVIMTAYNRELFLSEAIESVLASSYKNFELIIVDDCSSDSSLEIARSYELKDQRIRVYVNQRNLGDYPNRNRAASYAVGDLLVSVDSDDKLYENSLQFIVDGFNRYPDASFGIINTDINDLNTVIRPYKIMIPAELIKEHFFKSPLLVRGPGASVVRRSFFNSIGGFPTSYGPANDMFYNLLAASNTISILFGYHFLFYRIHGNQERNNEKAYIVNNFNYLRDYILKVDSLLTSKEKKVILKNNTRRFVLNTLYFFLKKRSFTDFVGFYRKVDLSWKDLKTLF